MTDKDIIFSLECCTSKSISCQKCKLLSESNCERELIHHSFDLIKRQQAEIERLKSEKERLSENVIAVMNSAENHYSELFDEAEEIVKSEAIREFAERFDDKLAKLRDTYFERGLKDYSLVCEVIHDYLYPTLREMVGTEK